LTTTGVDQSTLPPAVQDALAVEGTVLTLPVQIDNASCNQFTMEVGPVPGLTEPIFVSYSGPQSGPGRLTNIPLCAIAQAVKANEAGLLVKLLNQSNGVNLASCDFLDALRCAGAAVTCGGACIAGPAVCIACLASIGLVNCASCLGL